MPIRQNHGGGLLSASATMSAKAQKPHADAAGHPSSGLKLSTGLTEPTLFLALVPCLVPPSITPPAARLANVPVRPMIQLAVTPVDVAQAWLYARFWHWHWSRASCYWLVNAFGMGIAAVLLPLFVDVLASFRDQEIPNTHGRWDPDLSWKRKLTGGRVSSVQI